MKSGKSVRELINFSRNFRVSDIEDFETPMQQFRDILSDVTPAWSQLKSNKLLNLMSNVGRKILFGFIPSLVNKKTLLDPKWKSQYSKLNKNLLEKIYDEEEINKMCSEYASKSLTGLRANEVKSRLLQGDFIISGGKLHRRKLLEVTPDNVEMMKFISTLEVPEDKEDDFIRLFNEDNLDEDGNYKPVTQVINEALKNNKEFFKNIKVSKNPEGKWTQDESYRVEQKKIRLNKIEKKNSRWNKTKTEIEKDEAKESKAKSSLASTFEGLDDTDYRGLIDNLKYNIKLLKNTSDDKSNNDKLKSEAKLKIIEAAFEVYKNPENSRLLEKYQELMDDYHKKYGRFIRPEL